MTGLRLAVLSLIRRRTATAAAVVCIALATLSSGMLMSVVGGTAASYDRIHTGFDAVVGPKSSGLGVLLGGLGEQSPTIDLIPYSLVRFLERKLEPRYMVPLLACAKFHETPVFATDKRYLDRPEDLDPPKLLSGHWMEKDDEAVIGVEASEKLRLRIGDHFLVTGLITSPTSDQTKWTKELTVAGTISHLGGTMDRAILTTLNTGWISYRWAYGRGLARPTQKDEAVTYIWIALKEGQMPMLERFIHVNSVAQLVKTREEIDFLHSLTSGGRLASTFLCACVLFLATIGMGVLANARFESLRPELGLLRALGYPRTEVAAWMVLEVILIALAGLAISVPLEAIFVGWADLPHRLSLTDRPTPWPTLWNGTVWIGALAAALAASAAPLLRLYRSDVQTAMQGL
jgi:hypothetical protein